MTGDLRLLPLRLRQAVSADPYPSFLRWALPRLGKRWAGYRRVRGQVESRLADRLQALGLRSLDAYRDYLEAHPDEWKRLDAMCRITVSRFYRDPVVFDALRDEVLPAVVRGLPSQGEAPLRAWSAGAASGEEPYTLRILWRHALRDRFGGRSLHVTASEAQAHMLERARRGCYQRGTLKDLPEAWIDRAFVHDPALDCGKHAEPYCLHPIYRRHVTWRQDDIRTSMPDGTFSVICCRNLVFTYFDAALQRRFLRKLLERLRPGGVLVLGADESLPDEAWPLDRVEDGLPLYRHRPS
ncbi:MAG: protein-glutamate O-methyltransferase CheR [Salinibacter sp.]|uniref:CheR family methyltransferase n=1 Tax=Salinibacter sp. TaxID=2065818 RepID=UPI0035D48001